MNRVIRQVFVDGLLQLLFVLLKLLRVGGAPLRPDGDEQGLHDAGKGRGEERADDTEELGPGNQGDQGDGGMQTNSLPDDARPDYISLDNMDHNKGSKNQHSDQPALAERDQYADGAGSQRSQHRDKFQHESQHAQQHSIGNMENHHVNSHQHADQRREDKLAANIAAHDSLQRV